MNEVTKINPQETALAADPMMQMIERIITDPNLPIERLTAVMDMRERQMDKDAEIKFNRAFAEMMGEMPQIPRNGASNRNTYSTVDDIVNTTRPVLSKFGLSLNWSVTTDVSTGIVQVTAHVRHTLGHVITSTLEGKLDKAGDNDTQKARSTETYPQINSSNYVTKSKSLEKMNL